MKTLAFSHSHAIKNQPDSLSLFVLGGRGGGHTLQAHYLLRGMGAICSAQASKTLLANATV